MSDIELLGYRELDASLQMLEAKMQKDVFIKALEPAAQVFLSSMQAKVPHGKTGKLAESLRVQVRKDPKGKWYQAGDVVVGVVGVYYARFVEFGHAIRKAAGEVDYIRKRWNSKHGKLATKKVSKEVGHVPAKQFIRPAFQQNEAAAMDMITEKLSTEIVQAFGEFKKYQGMG